MHTPESTPTTGTPVKVSNEWTSSDTGAGERFKDLAARLIAVPKIEIDSERERERRAKD